MAATRVHPAACFVVLAVALRPLLADGRDGVGAASWVVLAMLAGGWLLQKRLQQVQLPVGFAPLVALAVLALGSWGWSADRGATLAAALSWLAVVVLALAVAALPVAVKPWVARALLAAVAVAAAVALRQSVFGFDAAAEVLRELGSTDVGTLSTVASRRAFGTFLAPDTFAAACAATLGLAYGLFVGAAWRGRILILLAVALLLAGFRAASSVGAAVALVAGIAVATGAELYRRRGRSSGWFVAGALTLLAVAGVTLRQRLAGAMLRGGERLANQLTGWRGFTEAPLRGHGHDTFAAVAPGLRAAEENLTRYAHGLVGQTASDLGMAGLLLLALALGAAGVLLVRRLISIPATPLERGAALGAGVALLHGLVDYDLMLGENATVLLVCVALAVRMSEHGSPLTGPRRLAQLAGVGLVLTALIALATWRAWAVGQVDQAATAVECAARCQGLAQAVERGPADGRMAQRVAREYLFCPGAPDRPLQLETWARRAVEWSPRDGLLRAELGFVLAALGRADEGRALVEAANQAWPRVPRIVAMLGLVALAQGRVEEARSLSAAAHRLVSADAWMRLLDQQLANFAGSPSSAPAATPAPVSKP